MIGYWLQVVINSGLWAYLHSTTTYMMGHYRFLRQISFHRDGLKALVKCSRNGVPQPASGVLPPEIIAVPPPVHVHAFLLHVYCRFTR